MKLVAARCRTPIPGSRSSAWTARTHARSVIHVSRFRRENTNRRSGAGLNSVGKNRARPRPKSRILCSRWDAGRNARVPCVLHDTRAAPGPWLRSTAPRAASGSDGLVCTRRPIALLRSSAVGSCSGFLSFCVFGFGKCGRLASTARVASSSTALLLSLVSPRAALARRASILSSSRWHSRRNTARSSACLAKSDSRIARLSVLKTRRQYNCPYGPNKKKLTILHLPSMPFDLLRLPFLRGLEQVQCFAELALADGAFLLASHVDQLRGPLGRSGIRRVERGSSSLRKSSTWDSCRVRMLTSTRSRWWRNAATLAFHSRSNASRRACDWSYRI